MTRDRFNLLYQITRAAYLAEEKNSLLGVLWHVLRPLAMTAVLYLVFSNFSGFGDVENYPLFILAGLIPFNFFSVGTTRAASALVRNRQLILNTTIPRPFLVFQAVFLTTIDFLVELALLLVLVAIVPGVDLTWSALSYLPLALALFAFVLGVGLLLSALFVFLRDLTYLWSVAMRMLFFATPIFYSLDMLDLPIAVRIIGLNPLAWLTEAGRRALLHGRWLPPNEALLALLLASVALAAGWFVFSRLERVIPEYA